MRRELRVCVWILSAGSLALSWGCGMGRGTERASSGDPEADQRAEMRMGSEGDADNGGGQDKGKTRTLYERLGGQKTIVALVDDVTHRITNDPRVNFERH